MQDRTLAKASRGLFQQAQSEAVSGRRFEMLTVFDPFAIASPGTTAEVLNCFNSHNSLIELPHCYGKWSRHEKHWKTSKHPGRFAEQSSHLAPASQLLVLQRRTAKDRFDIKHILQILSAS